MSVYQEALNREAVLISLLKSIEQNAGDETPDAQLFLESVQFLYKTRMEDLAMQERVMASMRIPEPSGSKVTYAKPISFADDPTYG